MIIKNPMLVKQFSDPTAAEILQDLDDVMNGVYIGMECADQITHLTGSTSDTVADILENLDLTQVNIQYRKNVRSTAIPAEGTLTLIYPASTATLPVGTHEVSFKFTPSNTSLYGGADWYYVTNICDITIS